VVRGSGASGVAAEGLGFAIPADTVREITSALIANGRVERPYLGIRWEWITPQLAGANGLAVDYGAFVTEVTPNSPASRSGLQRGDVLTGIDGMQIGEETPFLNLLLRYAPGDRVTIGVQRGGSEFQVEVTLAERPRL
jgi:2-alkenal reductase